MAWNHRSTVVAMAVTIQSVIGTYAAPNNTTDLIAVSVPNNAYEAITADDPTATGAIWRQRRILLGTAATAGATIPLRGPGGASPPAANAWPVGRVLQSAGFAEVISTSTGGGTAELGGTTTTLITSATLNPGNSPGQPLGHGAFGTGFRATSLTTSYDVATKTATFAEAAAAPITSGPYTQLPHIRYVLGTMAALPPALSISIWRDKKRYNFKDWRPTSLTIDVPVTNEQNSVFPSIDFAGRGTPVSIVDEAAPALPNSILQISPPPARGGKFIFDRVKLGHQSLRFSLNIDVGAASNQNQDLGQDAYDITSGTRTISLDLNQMNVTDMDLEARVNAQTVMPIMSTWGTTPGNRFGLLLPNNVLDPLSPGDRNGFVNLTGDAHPTDADNSAVLAIWW